MSDTKPKRSVLGFLFRLTVSSAILFLAICGAVLCSKASSPPKRELEATPPPAVTVETVTEQTEGITFCTDGSVVPFREVPLATEVAGRVTFVAENCRTGRYVDKGDVLVKIDPTDYELELAEARQQVVQAERSIVELDTNIVNAKSQLEIANRQLEVQRRELERVTSLLTDGAISQTDVDSTRMSELQKQDAVQTLENQIRSYETQKERLIASMKLSEVKVQKAELNLERCTIKAPLEGVVTALNCEQDKYMARGEKLVTIHDTSRLEVQCSLYMKHVEWLWSTQESKDKDPENYYQFPPTPVKIVYAIGGVEYYWNGTLEYLDGAGLDARTRMMPCRVVVKDPLDVTCNSTDDNATPSLLPGMFVQVLVKVVPRRKLLNLSEMAILPGGAVWKVVDNKMHKVLVTTAQLEKDRVFVYDQPGVLEAGEQVIVSPIAAPIEGGTVRVVP